MRILIKQNIEDLLFLDIETAPATNEFSEDHPLYDAWEYYCIKNGIEDILGSYEEKAALEADFGIIVCITLGIVRNGEIRLKTFSGPEKQLLEDFNDMLDVIVNNKTYLCGHVITGFDAPFIMKRSLVNGVKLNTLFDVAHLKPWEVSYLDTATLWKGTGFKMSTLIALTAVLGLPSPKSDISGADVGRVFYNDGEEGLKRIIEYCERDVAAVVNVVRKLRYEEPLPIAEIEEVEPVEVGIIEYLWNGGEYTEEVAAKLKEAYDSLSAKEKIAALEIINALPSKAQGKVTDITKADIKKLIG